MILPQKEKDQKATSKTTPVNGSDSLVLEDKPFINILRTIKFKKKNQ